MRTILLCLCLGAPPVWALAKMVIVEHSNSKAYVRDGSYVLDEKFVQSARDAGYIGEIFQVEHSFGAPAGQLIFARVVRPKDKKDCAAIFCKDPELYEGIFSQVDQGRLVLVAPYAAQFLALTLGDIFVDNQGFFDHFPDANPALAILVITPRMDLSGLQHEIVHIRDYESGFVADAFSILKTVTQEKIADPTLMSAVFAICELRAYDSQARYVKTSHRQQEWDTSLSLVDGEKVSTDRIGAIHSFAIETTGQILRNELISLRRAAQFPEKIDQLVRGYLPLDGPLSYDALKLGPR